MLKTNLSQTLKLFEPLGYLDCLKLMSNARIVITDSGGIQEETTVLVVPCLTVRENTERLVTISEGTNQLVGTSKEAITSKAMEISDNGMKRGKIPKLWDDKVAKRILEIILRNHNH